MNNRRKTVIAAVLVVVMGLTGCSASDERARMSYDYSYSENSVQTASSSEPASIETSTTSIETSFDTSESEPVETSTVESANEESDNSYSYDEGIVYIRSDSKKNESHEPEPIETSTIESEYSDIDHSDIDLSGWQQYLNSNDDSNTSKPETSIPSASFNSVDAIKTVCGIKSDVETDYTACLVLTESDHNPYDVEYDYGATYDKYVDACDWDLVFDADFYMEKFPLLAIQYHNDESLLLEHFQTIGVHEGRQGNANFNVGKYMRNCGSDIKNAFGDDYEGYYFYYMLNYDSEKSVDAASSDGKIQQKTIMTAYQAEELKAVNAYRREVGSHDIEFDSELAAWSNFRGYINAHDGYRHHDWFEQDTEYTNIVYGIYNYGSFSENTATKTTSHPKAKLFYEGYRNSEDHYKAMVADKNDLIGIGNCFYGTGVVSQFDSFINLK